MAAASSNPRQQVAFSTRFLPSDGIPVYNALLDPRLGKRREFLLGTKHSLRHLQRTGAIARVEAKPDNPSQYVVVIDEPTISASAATSSAAAAAALRRAPTLSHELYGQAPTTAATSVKRSESTPQLALVAITGGGRGLGRRRRRRGRHNEDSEARRSSSSSTCSGDDDDAAAAGKPRPRSAFSRSASTTLLTKTTATQPSPSPSPSVVIDRLRRRRGYTAVAAATPADHGAVAVSKRVGFADEPPPAEPLSSPPLPPATAPHEPSTVERLLANDAAFQLKLQILRDEMRLLETERQFFDAQIAAMRKRLRGVNAVHDNDVAVAHCSSVMHARLSKAEEEFMKLVTAQQQVKTAIDALRRELLAMRKVERKLVGDIDALEATNASVDAKVRAAKSVCNGLSQELLELERRAELEAEEQRLKLPPEEEAVVDAQELVSALQQRQRHGGGGHDTTTPQKRARRSTVVLTAGSPLEILQRMLSDKAIVREPVTSDKPLLSFRRAFRVVEQTLALDARDECSALERFVQQFEATEDVLLSKHKLNVQMQEEVDLLEKDAAELTREATQRQAAVRGTQHLASATHQQLQDKTRHVLHRVESYNELRELRSYEQTRLRAIMQRCLEILHAETLVSGQSARGRPLLLSELSLPAMLEAMQKKMTEVAITLKLHQTRKGSVDGADPSEPTTTTTTSTTRGGGGGGGFATDRRGSVHSRLKPGSAGARRSNLLFKREVGLSKVVLGPREPSGAALTAIRITAQPPTVEGAQVLSETHAEDMHALHPTIIPSASGAAGAKSAHKLTITRMASIRAGKRASTLASSGSLRRISEPVPAAAPHRALVPPTRPARMSMMCPGRSDSSRSGSSSDSLIHADDAFAHVVQSAEELDVTTA